MSSSSGFDVSESRTTLFGALLDARSRFGRSSVALEDHERQPMTYGRLLLASLVLGRKLAGLTQPGEHVGILLPNVQAVAAVLLGLNAYARVATMLNFTAGAQSLETACALAGVRTIITSRRFIDQAKLDETVASLGQGRKIVWLEDLRDSLTTVEKLAAIARSFRARAVQHRLGVAPDDAAVILFTSGSEGAPKAVVLSNANLVANARQIAAHAAGAMTRDDVLFNPLPVFHSFGLTAGLLVGILNGIKVVLYPSPLHYRQVPKMIRGTRATILFATDTFLQGYIKAAAEHDLASVRYVIAGAERVRGETRNLWNSAGATILEGYGATECSPVIACNLPDDNRPGTVGRFLPDIEWRLAAVEGIHQGGRLSVRGPNVMKGYLDPAAPGGLAAPAAGWHDTGDIVTVDDGFVTICGRAKRFAKIAGEMVPFAAVEALAQRLWPACTHVVVSLPDPRKGEQIVLVTDQPGADLDALQAFARQEEFPPLWTPRAVLVAAIPVLGSGKVDYAATAEMVRTLRSML